MPSPRSTEPNAVQPTLPELEIEAGVYVYNPYAESFKSHSKGERASTWAIIHVLVLTKQRGGGH